MHTRQGPAKFELMSILHESLRSFQQRRETRRSRYADVTETAPPPSSGPKPAATPTAGFDLRNTSPTMMGPRGFVEVDGHAIPVMDPEFLQALQDNLRGGNRPATPPTPAANDTPSTPTNNKASSEASGTTQPAAAPYPAPPSPPQATAAPPPKPTAAAPESAAAVPTTPPIAHDQNIDQNRHDELKCEHGEQIVAILREHEARLKEQADTAAERQATLLREHEARLKEQADAAAERQSNLLRELTATHRTQMDEQAARHTAVIRDLLRENQNFLDERASAAVTREAQLVGALLREHREALAQAHETHCQTLDDVLEQHRGELRTAQPASGVSGEMRQLQATLLEYVKIQHTAHAYSQEEFSSLLQLVQKQGENIAALALHLAQQQDAWLPPPNLPPPPAIPSVQAAVLPPGLVAVTPPILTAVTPPTLGHEATSAAPEPTPLPRCATETNDSTAPENTPAPSRPTAAMRLEAERRELARIHAAVADDDDDNCEADDDLTDNDGDDPPPQTRRRPSPSEDIQHA